jgi:glutathione S-transferase
MKLYGSYTSPFVRHCRIVLQETGLECEFIETNQDASAAQSPTQRVPFFSHGQVFLTDSSAIIKYLREYVGGQFLVSAEEFDQFCTVNTALDTTVNVFFLQRDGVDIQAYPYTQRQQGRIATSLVQLNNLDLPRKPPYSEVHLRLGCYLSWGLMRQQISLANYPNLQDFLTALEHYPAFALTAPAV